MAAFPSRASSTTRDRDRRSHRRLIDDGATLRLPDFRMSLDPARRARADAFLAAIARAALFAPPGPHELGLDAETLAALEHLGEIEKIADGVYFAPDAWRELVSGTLAFIDSPRRDDAGPVSRPFRHQPQVRPGRTRAPRSAEVHPPRRRRSGARFAPAGTQRRPMRSRGEPPHERRQRRMPATLARPTRHLFLSPHYDDIPLSTGATVRLLSDSGLAPETLVVFGSEPDRGQAAVTLRRGNARGLGSQRDEVIASRQAEEARRRRGPRRADARPAVSRCHLPRRLLSLGRRSVRVAATEEESCPPAEIVSRRSVFRAHRMTDDPHLCATRRGQARRPPDRSPAADELASSGWDVWFYEDIPYALKPNGARSRLDGLRRSQLH